MSLPDRRQITIWKGMSLGEKCQLLISTVHQAREFKRMGLRMKFPNDSPTDIESKLARIWLHARP